MTISEQSLRELVELGKEFGAETTTCRREVLGQMAQEILDVRKLTSAADAAECVDRYGLRKIDRRDWPLIPKEYYLALSGVTRSFGPDHAIDDGFIGRVEAVGPDLSVDLVGRRVIVRHGDNHVHFGDGAVVPYSSVVGTLRDP